MVCIGVGARVEYTVGQWRAVEGSGGTVEQSRVLYSMVLWSTYGQGESGVAGVSLTGQKEQWRRFYALEYILYS